MNTDSLLGLDLKPDQLTFSQIGLRGIMVFGIALVAVRLADKRFLSNKTTFDAILGFILASMLARAVNGSAAFWPTLGGGFVLVALHRVLAILSRRWHRFGLLVKGSSDLIIRNGQVIQSGLLRNDLSEHDLLQDLRLNGHVTGPEEVKLSYMERNGEISVVPLSK